jgi:predicted GIY-YIG superfamily endonuclease
VYYVYKLRSLAWPERTYVGFTAELRGRLRRHNAGEVRSTRGGRPWRVEVYLGFEDRGRAMAFERYLKSGSGKAFMKRRL